MPSSLILTAPVLMAFAVVVADPTGQHEVAATATHQEPSGASVMVTNDSPQFCKTLLDAIDTYASAMPSDVRALRDEGISLCERGHERLGVMRLRRALVALKEEDATKP